MCLSFFLSSVAVGAGSLFLNCFTINGTGGIKEKALHRELVAVVLNVRGRPRPHFIEVYQTPATTTTQTHTTQETAKSLPSLCCGQGMLWLLQLLLELLLLLCVAVDVVVMYPPAFEILHVPSNKLG